MKDIDSICLRLGLLLALVLPAAASAQYGVEYFSHDQFLNGVFSDSLFVAEGRLGDAGGTEQWELGLGNDQSAPATTAQMPWVNGQYVDFAVDYFYFGRLVTFTVGGETLSFETLYGFYDSIFLRAETRDAGTKIVIDELELNDIVVPGAIRISGPDCLRILQIYHIPANQDLRLTGRVRLSWSEEAPPPADLNFRIRFTNMAVVGTQETTFGGIKRLFR